MRLVALLPLAALLVLAAPGTAEPPADGDAAVLATLERFLSSATYPDRPPIDLAGISPDIVVFWSNGKTTRGRPAVLQAFEKAHAELARDFESFGPTIEEKTVTRRGDAAWVFGRIRLAGKLTEGRGTFERKLRSTFVLERHEGRWRVVHEHSSRIP